MSGLRVLIVDDEPRARVRMRELLDDCRGVVQTQVVGEAENGLVAIDLLGTMAADVALVDIHMPGMSGIELARHIQVLASPPAVIFVTAHDQYAVDAFEVNAIDYVLKPARAERLAGALKKAGAGRRLSDEVLSRIDREPRRYFSVSERGRVTLVPVGDVLYLKAELKYVTVRTQAREFLIEESLARLEEEYAGVFVRIHRNCLVARRLIRGFERVPGEDSEAGWVVRLEGCDERLAWSRRQWAQVRNLALA